MKRFIALFLTLALLLTLTACAAAPTEVPPPLPTEQPAPLEPAPAPEKPFPGKIAIITNDVTCNEEEYRSAAQMVAKYGEEKVIHKLWPVKFPEEGGQMIRIVQQIAEDPDVKALIINQAVQNTLAAVDKQLEIRSDIFLVACQPTENPPDLAQRFNLILNTDEVGMGQPMAQQAQKLGAKTFGHLSFPRHLSYATISARHEIIMEECAKLGKNFVDHTVPDPTGDIGMAGAQQVMLEEIPKLVKEYGEDTAFFCTNCGLQIPLIKAVVDAHGIYVQPCCPSPFHGFPNALGLVGEDGYYESVFSSAGTQDTAKIIVARTREKLAEKNMLGRVSTWPVPPAMMSTVAAAEYAIKWINGEVPKEGIDIAVLEQCMADYAGVECFTRSLGSHESDLDIAEGTYPNWLLVREDYLTFEKEEDNVFAPVSSIALDIDPSPESDFRIRDGVLLKYNGNARDVGIPIGITAISSWAFEDNNNLQSIIIPQGVTSIGGEAFKRCSSLISVKMPDSITFIGEYAFAYCYSLQYITIPNSVTSIGWYAFLDCSSLQTITIPDSVDTIRPMTFSGCSSLQAITIPNSVTSISGAFKGCSSLQTITIPNSVTSISGAISDCTSLRHVTIP
jgi:hypothetical protein